MRAAIRFVERQVRARPLACFAAAFLLGLILRHALSVPTAACGVALAAAAGLGFALRGRQRALAALILLAGLLAGMGRMGLALDAIRPVETRYSVEMTGRVVSEPFTNPTTGRRIMHFRIDTADGEPCGLRVRLYLRGEPEPLEAVEYGQILKLTGHIWAADPVTNPYEFDFGAYLHRQGLDAYATAKIEAVEIAGQTRDLRAAVIAARQAVAARIDALFPDNAGMMRALVLGDRSMLGDEQRDALNRSGTAHLISISGLHVTALAALLAFVLGRFMPRKWANALAVALLIPYGALIGFTAPFVRALVMFAIFCFAPIAGLPSDAVTRLCAAMLGWLAVRPLSIGDTGFALSFSASAGILLLMPPLSRLFGIEAVQRQRPSPDAVKRLLRRAALYLPSLLCATLAAQLATLPIVVAFFGVQSVVSVPANLVCVPLCMLGYLLGLAALLLSLISTPLAVLLAVVPDRLFTWLMALTRFSAALPLARLHIGRYPFALVLVHWGLVLAASDLSRISVGLRRWLPFGLAGVAAVSSLLVLALSWPFSIVFLDAGQADCAVVRARGHTLLIDTGDTYTPVSDYLNATCLHLDGVLLSHPHQDHAGGLSDVLASFRPDAVYVPKGWFEAEKVSDAVREGIEAAQRMGVEIVELSAGDTFPLSGNATLEIYSPVPGAPPDSVNDLSLLALVACEGQKALFTGDLSVKGEPALIPDADVLKVAHHGSDKATSERFLAACTPEIAVISVGENNYGHPSAGTVEKLAAVGAEVLLTRDRGAVTLTWRNGAWHTDTFLEAAHELE